MIALVTALSVLFVAVFLLYYAVDRLDRRIRQLEAKRDNPVNLRRHFK